MSTGNASSARPDTTAVSDSLSRKVIVSSMIGTTVEWCDFFLYGSAAALIFDRLFFLSSIRRWTRCSR